MHTRSTHLLVEYRGCHAAALDDDAALEVLLRSAADAARVRVVDVVRHRFTPHGASCVVVIEESHLSVHTWPEHGYAAVDFYTCGDGDPLDAHPVLRDGLGATQAEVVVVERGLAPPGPGISVTRRWVEGRPDGRWRPVDPPAP